MRFFKIDVKYKSIAPKLGAQRVDEGIRDYGRRQARYFNNLINDFNANNDNCFFTLSNVNFDAKELTAIAYINNGKVVTDKIFTAFTKYIDVDLINSNVSEITFRNFESLLRQACSGQYIDDDDEIMERYKLDTLQGIRRYVHYSENIIVENIGLEQCNNVAERTLSENSFGPEIQRIYASKKKRFANGHPVQYLLAIDDVENRKIIYRTLLAALYNNNRLLSKRYIYINVDNDEDLREHELDALYQCLTGCAIVIRFPKYAGSDSEFSTAFRTSLLTIGDLMYKYRNQVLTVVCFPRECTKHKEILFESAGNLSYIELADDPVMGEAAEKYLKLLAKENSVTTNKALFASVQDGKTYYSNELQNIFDKWYDNKLKTTIYPQYKDSAEVKLAMQKSNPKGNAYQQLNEMVGLGSAKEIINNAIDYYKAQKLFKEKGINNSNVSMNLAFLGSSGTNKTSTARILAEIFKENKILSSGHIVECGRADLVGKYVGSTAPLVKRRFKEAMGGVLFIDEAYSLVDNVDGLYGDEAIATIVQEMENHRSDMVVIFAGYPDKMQKFFDKNPGLRSRIAFNIEFKDYTPSELLEITKFIAKKNDCVIDPDADDKLLTYYEHAIHTKDFGNGRAARNIVEHARLAQASRLVKMDYDKVTKDDICTLKPEDFILPEIEVKETKTIGFCA